jgi:DNA-binding transcriptional LysR family regulator
MGGEGVYFPGVEVFLAIVQGRSLTKAAEILHLSQSTVSYRLKTLELQLGAVLVERSQGVPTIGLTPFGENFVGIAERWRQLQRETEMLQASGPQVQLVVGAADSLNVYVLPPLYRELTQMTPQLRLQIRTQHTLESYESVERREIDVAFVKMEREVSQLRVEPFLVDEMVLVRCAGSAAAKEPAALGDLDRRHELFMSWGPDYDLWHERWWGDAAAAHIRLDTAGLIFNLLQEPRQWALVPCSIAAAFLASGCFVAQPLLEPPPPRVCYLVTHRFPRPAARPGLDLLAAALARVYPDLAFPGSQQRCSRP